MSRNRERPLDACRGVAAWGTGAGCGGAVRIAAGIPGAIGGVVCPPAIGRAIMSRPVQDYLKGQRPTRPERFSPPGRGVRGVWRRAVNRKVQSALLHNRHNPLHKSRDDSKNCCPLVPRRLFDKWSS